MNTSVLDTVLMDGVGGGGLHTAINDVRLTPGPALDALLGVVIVQHGLHLYT